MAKKIGTVRISVDVPADVNEELKLVAKSRYGNYNVGPMLRDMALAELANSRVNSETNNIQNVLKYKGTPLSSEHRELVMALIAIFQSGNQKAVRAVSENIKVFDEYARVMNGGSLGTSSAKNTEGASDGGGQTSISRRRDKKDSSGGHPEASKTGTDGG